MELSHWNKSGGSQKIIQIRSLKKRPEKIIFLKNGVNEKTEKSQT